MPQAKYPDFEHSVDMVEVGKQLAVPHARSVGQHPPFNDAGHKV
jgi:hypothetical protein